MSKSIKRIVAFIMIFILLFGSSMESNTIILAQASAETPEMTYDNKNSSGPEEIEQDLEDSDDIAPEKIEDENAVDPENADAEQEQSDQSQEEPGEENGKDSGGKIPADQDGTEYESLLDNDLDDLDNAEPVLEYDPQPVTLEEVQAVINSYEALPVEEQIKPHWQFEVHESLMPAGYICIFMSEDLAFGLPYYTFSEYMQYDPQPTTMQEVQDAIDYHEARGTKPRWQFEVDAELMPVNYYCTVAKEPSVAAENDGTAFEEEADAYYTFYRVILMEESPVPIYNEQDFRAFLTGNQTAMQLMTDIDLTLDLGPTALTPGETPYDVDRDLTIYGKNDSGTICTLTFKTVSANRNYLRLTGSHTLKIVDLNIVSDKEGPFHTFTIYDLNNDSAAVWNAEFQNITFKGGGLIGTRSDFADFKRGKIGDITFTADAGKETAITLNKESAGAIGMTGAQIQSDAGTVTFAGAAVINAYSGTTAGNGVVYANNDIAFENDLIVNLSQKGANNGLAWSGNGNITFNGNIAMNASGDINTSGRGNVFGFICAPVGTIQFNQNTNITISDSSLLYSPVFNPIVSAKTVQFFGSQTVIDTMTPFSARQTPTNYGLICAENIELGEGSSPSSFTMTGTIDSTYFKSPGSSDSSSADMLSLGNFTVNPNATVEISRERRYGDSMSYLSNRNLVEGYTNFSFGENCVFTAKAGTNYDGGYNLTGRTALIRSNSVNRFILESGAKVTLESTAEGNDYDGITGLILKKPDNGTLEFNVKSGADLSVAVYGKTSLDIHGGAPIAILGNPGKPDSKSITTIQGSVSAYGKLGNGWYYQYLSLMEPSGKDVFDVDGGQVTLNADCEVKGWDEGPIEYAAFEHYTRNNLELTVQNGGTMRVISNGWRAMSLAGGEAVWNYGTNGIKSIEVTGAGSKLMLEGAQFGIAAESQAQLYIKVLDGGTFESHNTQDSNLYTTGLAEYTVSGHGSQFILKKSGKSPSTGKPFSLYGAIFHDLPLFGPLKIKVTDGGTMRVVSDYGSRAAICAQTSIDSPYIDKFVHEISVTGADSKLEVINNSTESDDIAAIDTKLIVDDALYPLGAIAFAANTSGNIYIGEGGSFYAESHHPLTPTVALGGYYNTLFGTGTLTLDSPGSVDIRNDSDNNGDIRAIALRGKTNYSQDWAATYYIPGTGTWRPLFNPALNRDESPTFKVRNAKVTVYEINGSSGTASHQNWHTETVIRSWPSLTIDPPSHNVGTMLNLENGINGPAAEQDANENEGSFSLYRYGRIAAGAAVSNVYTVTYSGNGGKTPGDQLLFDGGDYSEGAGHHVLDNNDIGFAHPDPGLRFLKWNTKQNGSGVSYVHGDIIVVNGDVILYAVWAARYSLPMTGGPGNPFIGIASFMIGACLLWICILSRKKIDEKINDTIKNIGKRGNIMKTMKKIGNLIMISAVLLSSLLPGMVVHAATEGSITIHKYRVADNIRDYTLPGDGHEITGAEDPVVNPSTGQKLSELTKLQGAQFTLVRVVLRTNNPLPAPDSIDIADYVPDMGAPISQNGTTDSNGKWTWSNLPLGIYLVTEIADGTVVKAGEAIDPFLVSVPMTNPTGTANDLYDIHVYPKNRAGGLDPGKKLVAPPAGTGSNILNWQVSVDIPSDIGSYTKLWITDPLDSRLTYLPATANVYYTKADGSMETLIKNTDYTEFYPLASTSNTLRYEITGGGFTKLANAYAVTGSTKPMLYFDFGTQIKDLDPTNPADWAEIENIANLATTDIDKNTTPEKTNPHGIEITKKDKDKPATTLEGAKFKLYPSKSDAKAGTNALKNPSNPANDWEVTTDADGKASFYGLSYGTYWLVETKTPNAGGYHLPEEPFEVLVPNSAPFIVQYDILNKKGFVLPTTGGEGTILFTVGGAVLIALAGIFLAIYLKDGKAWRNTGK